MKIKLMSLAVASLFVSNSLLAADKSWTGLKIGIGGGGSSSQAKTTNSASHNFNESSRYQTSNDPASDTVVNNLQNPFTDNNKFDPRINGTPNDYVEAGSTGVIHNGISNFDNNNVLYDSNAASYNDENVPNSFITGTNYYNRDYQISEGFLGEAFDKLDLGKSAAFGTVDVTYDWQLNDTFVIGLTASANFAANQKANGAASGGNTAGWDESLSYDVVTNSRDGGGGGGGGGGESYSSLLSTNQGFPVASHGQQSFTGMRSSFETQNSFDIGARLGFLPTNNTLVYVAGGFSTMKVKQKTSYRSIAAFGEQDSVYGDSSETFNSYSFETSKSDSEYKPGYFLGAGIETRMTDTVSLKLEYRYADYGTINSRASSNNASIQDGVSGNEFEFYNSLGGSYNLSQKTDITTQSIRAVLSYNF